MQINDPPTAAQVSVMIERMNNLADDVREMRNSQARIEQVVLTMAGIQRDLAHLDEKVRHLFTVSDVRGGEATRMDKRLSSLERWHKIIGSAVLAATGMIGWGIQRIEYLYQMDTRIQILELQVNARESVERSFQPPAAAGSK